MELFDQLYGILFTPYNTLQDIAYEEPVIKALGVSFIASFILMLGIILSYPVILYNWFLAAILPLITAAASIIILFIITLFLFLVAHLLDGRGTYFSLLSTLGFSRFILIFGIFKILLLNYTEFNNLLPNILSLIILFWLIVLTVYSISASQNLSTGKAVLSLGITIVTVIASVSLFVMTFTLLIGAIIGTPL